jgi:hypothetical protein
LLFRSVFGYNTIIGLGELISISFLENMMKQFYYETWLPFTFNKKRILLLAIASYIALC